MTRTVATGTAPAPTRGDGKSLWTELEDIFEHLDWVAFTATAIISALLITAGVFIGDRLGINGIGWLGVVVSILYIYESIQTVEPGRIGALVFLGRPYKQVGPGPVFAPRRIIGVITEDSRIKEIELPAEPENIWRGTKDDENAPSPDPKLRPPIRIKFGKRSDDERIADDPYNIRIVAEVPIVVSYQLTDILLWLENMGDHAEARKNLEDTAIKLFNASFATVSPAYVNLYIEKYSNDLLEALDAAVETWGIEIRMATIKPIVFSHNLNKAVVAASEAIETAKATRTTAAADRDKAIEAGRGAASAARDLLLAEADGLLAKLSKQAEGTEKLRQLIAKPGGLDVVQLQTLVDALKNGNNTFLTGGDGLVQSLLGAVQTAINQKGKK
ncbi:MAG: SPFH domain-containing protein [bacterium]